MIENVMDHKVTRVLRETEDYFVVLTVDGIGFGAVGNFIFVIRRRLKLFVE